jgi:hypothetical protein
MRAPLSLSGRHPKTFTGGDIRLPQAIQRRLSHAGQIPLAQALSV